MLPLTPIATVTVTTSGAASAPAVFDTGLLLVKDASFTAAKRLRSYASSAEAAAGLIADGFASSTEAYKAAQKYFAASPAPARLLVSCYPASESPIEALDAVLDLTSDFYGVALADTRTDEELLALDAHIAGLAKPAMLFLPLIGTAASVVAEGSLLNQLFAATSRRTVATCAAALSDAAAVMGTAMGQQLAHKTSAFALCYKSVGGMQPSDFTQSQVDSIKALNGNVYLVRGYTHMLLENGTTPSGRRYDEMLYLDMIADALQSEAVALLAENTDKLPQTDDSSARFINRFSSVLATYATRGVLASARWRGASAGPVENGEILENGFALWADSYDNQSEADRQAHKAVPIQVALTLAGSLESVVINVNVQL